MKAIFYDRKNKRDVSSDELHSTKLIREIAVGDSQDESIPTGRRLRPETNEPYTKEEFETAVDRGHVVSLAVDLEWEMWPEEKTPRVLYLREDLISDLCYKSENCPSYCNWDLDTTINVLVFLRLE